jgi:hypothetical protein
MALYPIIGGLLGHGYPRSPSFGVAPCPTTIFTFGLLLWTSVRVPIYVLAIPLLWSLIGFSAALWLGIREDIGLPIAGVLSTALLVWRDGVSLGRRASQSATRGERDVSAPAPRPERVAVRTSGSPSPSARSEGASGGPSL